MEGRGCQDFEPIMWVLREFVEIKLWWDSERRDKKLPVAIFRLLQRHLLLWEFWYQSQISVYNSSPGHSLSHREREVILPKGRVCSIVKKRILCVPGNPIFKKPFSPICWVVIQMFIYTDGNDKYNLPPIVSISFFST